MTIFTGGSEKMRVTSDGYQRMASGTGGIQFNGDTAAANALDDYEEGTFSPTILYTGTNTPSYYSSGQVGRYTKIGRIVQVQIYLNWNKNGSTGNVSIRSLPFVSADSIARSIPSILSFGLVGATSSITGFLSNNSTFISLFLNDNMGTLVTDLNTDSDQDLYATFVYEVS
jgi:hypothetical protein